MITIDKIENEYQTALQQCSALVPLTSWAHPPQSVGLTDHKTKYGMATHDGRVLISKAFLGTNAITKLRNTLRHELAHLAVGLRHGHNRVFKRCAILFNALQPVSKAELDAVHNNTTYKWKLIAHFFDGSSKDLGGVHRRSKRFSEYPRNGRQMLVEGELVAKFEFEPC